MEACPYLAQQQQRKRPQQHSTREVRIRKPTTAMTMMAQSFRPPDPPAEVMGWKLEGRAVVEDCRVTVSKFKPEDLKAACKVEKRFWCWTQMRHVLWRMG
jgi:hypothetical protein